MFVSLSLACSPPPFFLEKVTMAKAAAFLPPSLRFSSSSSSSRNGWSPFRSFARISMVASSNGAPARVSGRAFRGTEWSSSSSCLVLPPPAGRKPRAIIKFLGGAFIGAVPEVTYSYIMELLAKEGYLVVSVPYNVTFDHTRASREVYEKFHCCMEELLNSGLRDANLSASDLVSLPFYCVGHSNGALLQLLVGSYFSEKIPQANVVVSFNNRPASEAVPYFEQVGPVVSQVMPIMEANPMISMARNVSGDAWKALLDTAQTVVQDDGKEAIVSLTKFVDQLPAVLNQVTQGTSEFKPTPPENRDFFKISYSVPHTLLVKFNADPIDESDTIEEVLRPRVESLGGTVEKMILSGNHLTPCVQDLKWQVGYQYTPADAIAQGLKSLSLNDTRVLARTITDWLKGLEK